MRLLVITSCTGEKVVEHDLQLTKSDFQLGPTHIAARERELQDLLVPAEDLYTGQQHKRLMRGVTQFRTASPAKHSVDLWILSAGYGLVSSHRLLAPYECTFSEMGKREARSWTAFLGVPDAFRQLIGKPYDLGIVLLGDAYLDALQLDESIKLGGPTFFVVGSSNTATVPVVDGARVVPLMAEDTRRFHAGFVSLKGEIGARLLAHLSSYDSIDSLLDPATDLLAELESSPPPKTVTKLRVRPTNSDLDDAGVIKLSSTWRAKPHRLQLRYFIPDWDDRVDPNFDFEQDIHSSGTPGWANEVYAHQLFPEPNYDGILASRGTIDESRAKRDLVYRLGIHRYLRVPKEFPVLGDCGAFSYVANDVPPYTTEDVLDYYTELGFDLGVSVDHLVFADSEEKRRYRYDLTIANADAFLREHRARGLTWEPVGAVQGWDPASYAAAVQKYVAMGYRYIALGGMVRSNDRAILRVLEAVREVIPPGIKIHLLGVAKVRALQEFVRLGVTSIDSASFLRRAWLGADSNYLTPNGWYAAIRVPPATGSFRAKQLIQQEKIGEVELRQLEAACLDGLRDHGRSRGSPRDDLVNLLMTYETLLAGERAPTRDRVLRTLEDRPWERCGCAVCEAIGIEVVIFRRNDRNRRRGFHNTYVFYSLIDQLLRGEMPPWLNGSNGDQTLSQQLTFAFA